jgi:hypothetical protein
MFVTRKQTTVPRWYAEGVAIIGANVVWREVMGGQYE